MKVSPSRVDPELVLMRITILLAMKRMAASNVLIVGVKGLGVEIGKLVRC